MMAMKMTRPEDEFELWDLRVEVCGDPQSMVCSHTPGEYFQVSGENLDFSYAPSFSMYALAAILPLLPAKQRITHPNDWMTTDAEIACPDPNCGARFRITRTGKSTFRHSETIVHAHAHAAADQSFAARWSNSATSGQAMERNTPARRLRPTAAG